MIASLEACRLARGRCSEDDSKAGRGVGSGGGDGGDDDDDALKACRRLVR